MSKFFTSDVVIQGNLFSKAAMKTNSQCDNDKWILGVCHQWNNVIFPCDICSVTEKLARWYIWTLHELHKWQNMTVELNLRKQFMDTKLQETCTAKKNQNDKWLLPRFSHTNREVSYGTINYLSSQTKRCFDMTKHIRSRKLTNAMNSLFWPLFQQWYYMSCHISLAKIAPMLWLQIMISEKDVSRKHMHDVSYKKKLIRK